MATSSHSTTPSSSAGGEMMNGGGGAAVAGIRPALAHQESGVLESFSYDDSIVRMFLAATVIWALVGMLAGLLIAAQMAIPALNFGLPYTSFGRLRPLHTNAVIFAFAGNAIFAAIYYSTQRLCKTRMFSDTLSFLHFWGWQLIIVSAAVTLPLGITQAKEYAELEWPIDLMIAVVWLGFFGVNFFGTLWKRRERHMYVALWFYIATIVTVTVLHVGNNLWIPAGVYEFFKTGQIPTARTLMRSYTIYSGVQDALMQWWYGHNAVAFFLTTPFLGMMYYFMPKAAERPVFSYRLSIVHFWSLVFIYIWAGPHHLHYTALPSWASTLGMLFSVMLWMPSWGGMINGLLTLRGAWQKVPSDPILKFFVVGITFYGMSTFEGPMMSIKSVNALTHYTDWTIAHVHGGALGWNGFMAFGMVYWLLPRLYQTTLWSKKLATAHFWLGTIGILLYVLSIYTAGVTQGWMWRAFDEAGKLAYPDFVETVAILKPMYFGRIVGGTAYLVGVVFCAVNFYMTWRTRPATYDVPVIQAPALGRVYKDATPPTSRLGANVGLGHKGDVWLQGAWHRTWERLPGKFTVAVLVSVLIASAFEVIPMVIVPLFSRAVGDKYVPKIASVQPYTPLELMGRDVYISEGCYNCHSQMIRPIWSETERYGEYSKPGEFVYDHPYQWGSRRIGPDLAREGVNNPNALWHIRHFENPRQMKPQSIMPVYAYLLTTALDFDSVQSRVDTMKALGVPYREEATKGRAAELAKAQAKVIAEQISSQGGPAGLEDKQVVALIAYLQRLGTDINKPAPAAAPAEEPKKTASVGVASKGVNP